MAIPTNARLLAAKNILVGDTLCFHIEAHNFRVARVDERDEPYPQVRLYSSDESLTLIYGINDELYVARSTP